VVGGIFTGNILQAGKGLLDLNKAAAAATGTMQTLLGSIARGAGIGAALAAPLILAMYKWRQETEKAEAAMQEMWSHQGEQIKKYAEEKEAQAKREIELNDAIIASYKRVGQEIDETTNHLMAMNAEKTKQLVAGAGSEDEKQKIQQAADVSNADLEIGAAEMRQRNAVANGDPNEIRSSGEALDLARAKRKTVGVVQSASNAEKIKALTAQRDVVSARAGEQQSASDFAGQDQSVAEVQRLTKAIKNLGEATVGAVKESTDESQRAITKIMAVRESGGGI
jgi:hypothetical protein